MREVRTETSKPERVSTPRLFGVSPWGNPRGETAKSLLGARPCPDFSGSAA